MIEVTKMWLMCRIFKRNERSWDKTVAIENLHLPGLKISLGNGQYRELTDEERGGMILREISKAKNYGVQRPGLVGAYLHRYRPWRRYKWQKYFWEHMEGYKLNYDGNNPKHQDVFSNAHSTLDNCIGDEFVSIEKENSNVVYLTGKGRRFARLTYPLKVLLNFYPVKTAIGWGVPLLLIYIFSHYLNINIQSK